MIVNEFYNGTTRRYVALFGSLFNKMRITRDDNSGIEQQQLVVPISYGPYQKFLAKLKQDPHLNRPQAISLPRMAFEIDGMSYDGQRKVNSLNTVKTSDDTFVYTPAPWNIEISLYIMTQYAEDGAKLIEQILPFFKPEYTFSAHILDSLPAFDIPLILNSVNSEDLYESDFITRRSLMWTLSFTMKAWFFGPIRDAKIIKFVDVHNYGDLRTDGEPETQITTQPGLDINGNPTTDINETVSYETINFDDDWGVITMVKDYQDGG